MWDHVHLRTTMKYSKRECDIAGRLKPDSYCDAQAIISGYWPLWLSAITYLKLRGAYFFHFKGPHVPRHRLWKGVLRLSIYHKLLWQRGRIGEDRDRVLPSSSWGQQEVQLQPFKVDLQTAHGTAAFPSFQLRKKLLDGKQEMSTWRNWDFLMGISWQKL